MAASLYLQLQPTLQKGLLSLLSHQNHNIYSESSRMHPPCRIRSGVVPLCQATPRRRAYVYLRTPAADLLSLSLRPLQCFATHFFGSTNHLSLFTQCVCLPSRRLFVRDEPIPNDVDMRDAPHGLAGQPAYVTGCLSLILGVFFSFYVPV